jgi:hypothetical protein
MRRARATTTDFGSIGVGVLLIGIGLLLDAVL